MGDFFETYIIRSGDCQFSGIPAYPFWVFSTGFNGTSKVGSSRSGYLLQDNSYNVTVKVRFFGNNTANPWSLSCQIFVGGVNVLDETRVGTTEQQIDFVSTPHFIPAGSSGEIQVIASVTHPLPGSGGVSVQWAGGQFVTAVTPANCDCCCCTED